MSMRCFVVFSLLALPFATAHAAPVRIVQNAVYHGDEVADVHDGESWVAIIPREDGHFIAKPVQVSVTTIKDEVLDTDKGLFSGKKISSLPQAVFLVAGLAIAADTDLTSQSSGEQELSSARPLTLKGPREKVMLVATGGVFAPDNNYISATPYQLSLRTGEHDTTLIAATTLHEKTPSLLWAGDVNGDGYPDLLLDISTHYNSTTMALFLSRVEGGLATYRKVAQRTSSGC